MHYDIYLSCVTIVYQNLFYFLLISTLVVKGMPRRLMAAGVVENLTASKVRIIFPEVVTGDVIQLSAIGKPRMSLRNSSIIFTSPLESKSFHAIKNGLETDAPLEEIMYHICCKGH